MHRLRPTRQAIAASLVTLLVLGAGLVQGAVPTGGDLGGMTGEVARLQRQVAYLAEALAAARAEGDALRARLDRAAGVGLAEPGVPVVKARVSAVNREFGLAVFDAGRLAGLRAGMMWRVLRSGRVVADARVIDVRAGLAGAVIERTSGWIYPEAGDEAVLVTVPRK